jgi:signal transduction histidine kinase
MPEPKPPQDPAVIRQRLLSQFHAAFALMGIIPLLICCYLITVKFFSLTILAGLNGIYFLLAVVFALLGLLAGQVIIRGVVERLVDLNVRLEQANQMQAEFVSHVSHEFRAPLTIVKGALDNLGDGLHGALTPDQQEPVAICRRELDRLRRLVGDLLDVARMEAGKLRMAQERVNLKECVTAVAQSFEGIAKERGLTLTCEAPTPATILGDRDRLSQVFMNLVGNAVKFTAKGGVRLRLTADGEAAQVEIIDTGRGIPPKDLERVFEKFERAGTEDQEGSGLGLSIAKAIVDLHHGRIWVESQLGKGSRFVVRLPLLWTPAP